MSTLAASIGGASLVSHTSPGCPIRASRPERTRSLPMLGFDPRYKDLALEPSCDLFWIRALEE